MLDLVSNGRDIHIDRRLTAFSTEEERLVPRLRLLHDDTPQLNWTGHEHRLLSFLSEFTDEISNSVKFIRLAEQRGQPKI